MADNAYRILLIEDDAFLMKIYKAKLSHENFEVMMTTTGAAALEAVTQWPPHLILLDLIMPGKNGFEILQELRANANLANTPIIILSNLGQDADIQKAMELGANNYVVKTSSSIQDVIEVIKQHLGLSQTAPTPPTFNAPAADQTAPEPAAGQAATAQAGTEVQSAPADQTAQPAPAPAAQAAPSEAPQAASVPSAAETAPATEAPAAAPAQEAPPATTPPTS